MLFNSFNFLIFLPTVFILYWFVFNKKIKHQNLLLLFASYTFYGWWDYRFLSLILFSSILDYICGLQIHKTQNESKRKLWLILSMSANLGFLGVFKYFNFFSNSLSEGLANLGYTLDALTLNVILPVGISFYTFQTMSYTIDVYRKKLQPTKFNYDKAADGLRQILWGLFKKIVIADNCAIVVNQVFDNYTEMSSSNLVIGVVFFAFQIYGDFSGYSDIAIGTARLFGFNLMQNFAFPYFSRDIAEFWRRWHISLSTWFRDYLYIPLGGSRGGTWMKIKNIFIIFIVSGFWHGANWTFIIWGALNALYFLPLMLLEINRKNTDVVAEGKLFISLKELFQLSMTFTLTLFAWIFFRAESLSKAIDYIKAILNKSLFNFPSIDLKPFVFIALLIIIEWVQREKQHGLALENLKSPFLRWMFYSFLFCVILIFGAQSQSFIYFQF